MAQRGDVTNPRSPGDLTPEHEWVTVMPIQHLQGSLDYFPNGLGEGSWHSTLELPSSVCVHR